VSIQRFNFDLGTLKKDLEELGRSAPLVMSRALNRAVTSGRAAMAKAISSDTGLASRYVSKEIRVDKAQRTRPVAAVEIAGRRIPLIAFQARGPEPSRGRGRGVSYRLPGGRGRVSDAFIATMGSGHRGVFKRKPGARRRGKPPARSQLPIMELRGPSLPHVFEKKFPVFRAAAEESLLKNLASEISFAQSKSSAD
jgi:Prophage minor tail protein Z (GPZ)